MSSDQSAWYHDAIIYEAHVRAFRDDNGDGIGDFKGLTSKLDYLRDLGVTALWLLPFYPSPLRDDGYDIADYESINPAYGTMRDFKRLLRDAHARDIKVITELVINHTSDQHPWFQKARNAKPGSPERDFYVWSDTPDLYSEARIIFQDTETSNWTWDPVAGAYYWHRFFSHQPDLNFENPAVHEAIFEVLDFWLNMGVDGLRLDAVPYLYERDGTMCENLPETHEFLKELRARMDEKYDDRLFIAEANQWPEDAVAYFGDGDECHMSFHFPLMPRLFMALRMENRFPILDILEQTPDIPDNAAWAIFLRNHDELTLEMVTDEERDYMYHVYAHDPRMRINVGIRRRLAPLLGNNRREIELLNGLLLSLPGVPVIYYGDEIGMGDNIYLGDRNGVRTPMQWSGDRNAGFSEANPQSLYFPVITDPQYHYESINVEVQRDNPNSLWWWMKRSLALRKSLPGLSRGTFEVVPSDNPKVLSFLRRLDEHVVLVVANLSRHVQPVTLELGEFAGLHPVEVLGRAMFPVIGESPYTITVGTHDIYWFSLQPDTEDVPDGRPRIALRGGELSGVWRARAQLQRALVSDIARRRWFRSKAATIRESEVVDLVEMPASAARIAFVRLEYIDADPEIYVMPLAVAAGPEAERLAAERPEAIVADITGVEEAAVLYDAMQNPALSRELLRLAARRRKIKGRHVNLFSESLKGSSRLRQLPDDAVIRTADTEQTNTSVFFGDELIMKLFRKVEAGANPEVEVGRFLTERQAYPNTPRAAGLVTAEIGDGQAAIAFFQDLVPSQQNLFEHTFDGAVLTLESILASGGEVPERPPRVRHPLDVTTGELDDAAELMGAHTAEAELLGQRTGEMHIALASDPIDPVFAPEPMSTLQQRSTYQAIRSAVRTSLAALRRRRSRLRPEDAELVDRAVGSEREIIDRLKGIIDGKIECERIRIHGDFHLGQVLFTGNDFFMIDFEGEPQRPLSQRRLKRLGLRDVAGMVRSYHYAIVMALRQVAEAGIDEDTHAVLDQWANVIHSWLSASFLKGYLEAVEGSSIVPSDPDHVRTLLDALVIEKAAYELEYEVNNRPDWVAIPLYGILNTLT
ncbi:MAG TPA: maltose alpha-D-glucosyltransferase [Acidimicrobiia bacterium]|nr:maltose alpha-D-glucosyltransferase [Acidimicrobiia bacterium]